MSLETAGSYGWLRRRVWVGEGSLREGAPAQQVEEYASYRENACKKVSRIVTSGIFKVTQTPSVAQMRATFLSEEGFLDLRIDYAAVWGGVALKETDALHPTPHHPLTQEPPLKGKPWLQRRLRVGDAGLSHHLAPRATPSPTGKQLIVGTGVPDCPC